MARVSVSYRLKADLQVRGLVGRHAPMRAQKRLRIERNRVSAYLPVVVPTATE